MNRIGAIILILTVIILSNVGGYYLSEYKESMNNDTIPMNNDIVVVVTDTIDYKILNDTDHEN